jgi:hypothetical protein
MLLTYIFERIRNGGGNKNYPPSKSSSATSSGGKIPIGKPASAAPAASPSTAKKVKAKAAVPTLSDLNLSGSVKSIYGRGSKRVPNDDKNEQFNPNTPVSQSNAKPVSVATFAVEESKATTIKKSFSPPTLSRVESLHEIDD